MSILGALCHKLGRSAEDARGWAHWPCPKCGSKGKPKFGVNISAGRFGCFHCHWSGFLIELMERLGISDEDIPRARVKPHKPDHDYPAIEIPGFHRFPPKLVDSLIGRAAAAYCHRRAGLDWPDLHELGWGWSAELGGRLIIPIVMDGVTVQYLARSVDGSEPKELPAPNAPRCPRKGEVVFGRPIRPGCPLALVEGVWDALAVERAFPVTTATAILGTYLSSFLLGYILGKRPGSITLLLDGDSAGEEGTARIARQLLKRKASVNVARPPHDKDPDELGPQEIWDLLTRAIPAQDWLIHYAARQRPESGRWIGRRCISPGP